MTRAYDEQKMMTRHEFVTCPTCGTKVSVSGEQPLESTPVVQDTIQDPIGRTLQWMIGPDRDMNWYQACYWVQNVKDALWRMPTIGELEGLGPKLHPDFKTSGWWIWSGDSDGPMSARGLDIVRGTTDSGGRELDSGGRIFAVR